MTAIEPQSHRGTEIQTLDDWTAFGREIIARAESAIWDLADWAAEAVRFGKKAKAGEDKDDWHTLKEFCAAHNLNYGAVKTYAWVSRQIPRSRRIDLSFAHHQTVSPLEPDDQDRWLAKAKAETLSVATLRELIRESLGDKSAKIQSRDSLHLPTSNLLELHHWLTGRPPEFWTDSTRQFWKEKLHPIVDFFQAL
jgi:hypothetical protein